MLYRLIILTGPKTGEQLTVLRPSMTIGSGSDCSVCIPDEEMASRHALFEHDATGLLIRDLGTMHKILVNHHQVEERRLKHGDEIEIGRTRFLVQATVRAEIDSGVVIEGLQRKRRRNPMTWVYLVAGLILAYFFARPFFASHESGTFQGNSAATNSIIQNKATVASNVVPQINTTTNRPMSAAFTNAAIQIPPHSTPDGISTNRQAPAATTNIDGGMTERSHALIVSNATTTATQKTQVAVAPKLIATVVNPSLTNKAMANRAATLPSHPIVRIASVEQHKFPGNASYEEMRTLTIKLKLVSTNEMNTDSVTVEVGFFDIRFDKNTENGDIVPSGMLFPRTQTKVSGPWYQDQQKVVTATYTVPNTNMPTGVRRPQFYGFTIRIFNGGVLQDQTCRPADLRNFISKQDWQI